MCPALKDFLKKNRSFLKNIKDFRSRKEKINSNQKAYLEEQFFVFLKFLNSVLFFQKKIAH